MSDSNIAVIKTGDYVEVLDGRLHGRRGKVVNIHSTTMASTRVIVDIPDYGPIPFHWFSVRVLTVLDLLAEI